MTSSTYTAHDIRIDYVGLDNKQELRVGMSLPCAKLEAVETIHQLTDEQVNDFRTNQKAAEKYVVSQLDTLIRQGISWEPIEESYW